MTDPRWYVLTVKPQHEFAVASALREKALEPFVPSYITRRRWSDRVKTLTLPLFSQYVFCRFQQGERTTVLRTPGVRSLVGFAGCAAAVPESEIAAIRSMVGSGLPVEPWSYLQAGERVRVLEGPLRGLEGLLAAAPEKPRVVVNVELLQRSVAVEIERAALEPVTPRRIRASA